MGCDIHLYVEKKVAGKWVEADKWTPSKYDKGRLDVENSFYDRRNYALFAILAGVRNEGFTPIEEPRGLPKDVTTLISKESEMWGGDGHSHSYFTLKELLNFDWTQEAVSSGWVNAMEFFRWIQYKEGEHESPESYCGGVGGGLVQHVTSQEMEKLIKKITDSVSDYRQQLSLIEKQLPHIYCAVEWTMPYYKSVRYFWSDTIPRLLRLGKPQDVRIVFWFDN